MASGQSLSGLLVSPPEKWRVESDSLSIRLRGNVYQIDIVGPDGNQHRVSARTKDKKAAELKEAALRLEFFSGAPVLENSLTLKGLINEYKTTIKKKWTRGYKNFKLPNLNAIEEFFGDIDLKKIDRQAVEDFQVFRQKVSDVTANRSLAVLKTVLNFAIRNEHLTRNRVCEVDFLDEVPDLRFLSKWEQKVVDSLCTPRLLDAVTVAKGTGMRAGEQFSVLPTDLDFSRDLIHVQGTKTKESDRFIRMLPSVREVFQRKSKDLDRRRPVFSDVGLRQYQKDFEAVVKEAGIPYCKWHGLRHTFASDFLEAGGSIFALSKILGHSNIRTTMIYSHLSPEFQKAEMDKLEAFKAQI